MSYRCNLALNGRCVVNNCYHFDVHERNQSIFGSCVTHDGAECIPVPAIDQAMNHLSKAIDRHYPQDEDKEIINEGLQSKQANASWAIDKIKEVAREFEQTLSTAASTGERIAAAFVLGRPEFLPYEYQDRGCNDARTYDLVAAWDRLDTEWQDYVRQIQKQGWLDESFEAKEYQFSNAKCTICGIEFVDTDGGIDTCEACVKNV